MAHRSTTAILALAVFASLQIFGQAATGTLVPAAYQTVLDANGAPISGAKICTYLAGTTTPTATYTTAALSVANANPITADSSGRWTAFLSPGASYKFIFQDSSGTPGVCDGVALKTVDGIQAVPAASVNLDVTGLAGESMSANVVAYLSAGDGGKNAGYWYKADPAQTYSSSQAVAIGVLPATILSGETGTIRLRGQLTGYSVAAGVDYYVGTSGGLTPTAPVNNRLVGRADSATSIVVEPSQKLDLASGSASVTGDFTTMSSSYTDVTGASVTLTTTGGPLLVTYSGPLKSSMDAALLTVALDGSNQNALVVTSSTTDIPVAFTLRLTAATAGSHTVKLRAKNSTGAGTVTIASSGVANAFLTVTELKR